VNRQAAISELSKIRDRLEVLADVLDPDRKAFKGDISTKSLQAAVKVMQAHSSLASALSLFDSISRGFGH
jgi:hypothetical protein